MRDVPPERIQRCNAAPLNPKGSYVLYWMISSRRLNWNHSLQRAVEWCLVLQKPLVILEALRADYPWANSRIHSFIVEGMAENARKAKGYPVYYYPYVEPNPGFGKGLLEALGKDACVVITDDFPAFFLPKMVSVASKRLGIWMEKVDSNGLVPMSVTPRAFATARGFRGFVQGILERLLDNAPEEDPLRFLAGMPKAEPSPMVLERWAPLSRECLEDPRKELSSLPVDGSVKPVTIKGGNREAQNALGRFLREGLPRYLLGRNHPDARATSGLSPYIHFGHISTWEILNAICEDTGLKPSLIEYAGAELSPKESPTARSVKEFLNQLVVWRELGFNFCFHRMDYQLYDSLPSWAKATLEAHINDPRPYTYDLHQLEGAQTHDPVWNAAQKELLEEGRIHNYMRMIWGKKIIEWAKDPKEALDAMIHLNNKYALDGRDPNSYTGIFWCLGRYDRPWGPERPIFGKVRYMSSRAAIRKLKLSNYLSRFGTCLE